MGPFGIGVGYVLDFWENRNIELLESVFNRTDFKRNGNVKIVFSVGGRGFPSRRIFPWARWGWGPGQIPELFGRRRRISSKMQKRKFMMNHT